MNRKEIEKMISLADDSYIEEMFTTKLYERKRHGAAWIAAAAAVAVAVGAAGIAINSANSDKIVADLQDIITETETDTSALENAVSTDFLQYRINCGDYFKNEPDDEAEYYYGLLKGNIDFTGYGFSGWFTAEYLDKILRFERKDFPNISGGMGGTENGVPLYAHIRLYDDDTENLPMAHMLFYSDESSFADFDKSPYTPVIYGDTELYGFDLSEEKDGSKLLACWRVEDTNYMFVSRGLGYDKFIEIISPYTEPNSEGNFTLDRFCPNSLGMNREDAIEAEYFYAGKGASEMNRDSVFAGYVFDSSPFAGLSLYDYPHDQNYKEISVDGETVYRMYQQLLGDSKSYEAENGSVKNYISLTYEWGENPNSDTVSRAPVIPFEEITPEKLDEVKNDEEIFYGCYIFVIPVNDFTITVNSNCDHEQLLEVIDALRAQSGDVTRLSLAKANSETPFAGYVPQSNSIEGLNLVGVIKDSSKREELRVQYRSEENGRETEYVHLYYSADGYMPRREVYDDNGEAKMLPPIQITPENLSAERLEGIKKFGSGDLTKHSFYLNINESEFFIRVEALCSSEKLMKFFEDMHLLQTPETELNTKMEKLREEEARREQETEKLREEEARREQETEKLPETVTYNGREFPRDVLSEEALEWLEWYNSLSEEEQLAVSYVPPELITWFN